MYTRAQTYNHYKLTTQPIHTEPGNTSQQQVHRERNGRVQTTVPALSRLIWKHFRNAKCRSARQLSVSQVYARGTIAELPWIGAATVAKSKRPYCLCVMVLQLLLYFKMCCPAVCHLAGESSSSGLMQIFPQHSQFMRFEIEINRSLFLKYEVRSQPDTARRLHSQREVY